MEPGRLHRHDVPQLDGRGTGRFLHWLEAALDEFVRGQHTAAAGLSSSRFMNWFAEAPGLPFGAYVCWLRLQRAVCTLPDSLTLTEAAYSAGFPNSAPAAHLLVNLRRAAGAAARGLG